MKFFFKYRKFFSSIVLPSLAVILVLLVWLSLVGTTISGDGFDYLIQKNIIKYTNFPVGFMHFYLFPGLISKYLVILFKNNFPLYSYFELLVLISVTTLTYILIFVVTKKRNVSFIGSLIVGLNYFGITELVATGMYAWFVERMLPILLLLPSFILLHLYLEKKNIKTLFASVSLYALCVFIFHFSTIFFLLYFLYPVLYRFYEHKGRSNILKGIWVSLIYLIIAAFMIFVHQKFDPGIGPAWTIKEFLLNPGSFKYPQNIVRQLVYWFPYDTLVGVVVNKIININQKSNPVAAVNDVKLVMKHVYFIVFIYIVSFFYTYFKSPKYRAILLTTTISTLFLLFMNDYMGRYNIPVQPGLNRYLFFPTFTLAIFWSLVVMTIFNGKTKLLKCLSISIFGAYCLFNVWLIQYHFFLNSEKEVNRRNIYKCVAETRPKAKDNTTVLMGAKYMGWYEASFINDWWGKGIVEYGINDEDWQARVKNTKNVQYLVYSNNQCLLKDRI